MSCNYLTSYDDIPGWITCTHPEGGRYFHHVEKVLAYIHYNSRKFGFNLHLQRIFTDTDLHDSTCFRKISKAISDIENFIAEHNIQRSEKIDFVLDLFEENDEEFIGYYFADHELRTVVFLHEFESECIPHWFEIKGINSGTHLRMSSSLLKQSNSLIMIRATQAMH